MRSVGARMGVNLRRAAGARAPRIGRADAERVKERGQEAVGRSTGAAIVTHAVGAMVQLLLRQGRRCSLPGRTLRPKDRIHTNVRPWSRAQHPQYTHSTVRLSTRQSAPDTTPVMGRGGSVPSPGGSNTREGATTAARQALTLFSKEGLPERLNGIPALLQVRSPLHRASRMSCRPNADAPLAQHTGRDGVQPQTNRKLRRAGDGAPRASWSRHGAQAHGHGEGPAASVLSRNVFEPPPGSRAMLHATVDWQGTCPLSRWMYDWYGAGGERRRFATRCLLTPLLWTYVCRCSNATVDVTGARFPVVPRRRSRRGLLVCSICPAGAVPLVVVQ
jgi:hypothetical protein